MSGEWMDCGDLWSLIPLSSHSFHSSITLILFTFHSIHSHSLSFSHILSLYPINTHSHSIHISFSSIPYYRSLHVHSLYHCVGDGVGVNYFIYSLIHYSYSCITITSFILSTTICPHSLPIHSFSSHTYSCHITSFIYHSSFSLPLSLDYLSLISLAILFHSLFHSIILFHSVHSHTHHTIHHSTLPLLITLVSIHLLSTPYTHYYHHISFTIQYTLLNSTPLISLFKHTLSFNEEEQPVEEPSLSAHTTPTTLYSTQRDCFYSNPFFLFLQPPLFIHPPSFHPTLPILPYYLLLSTLSIL